MNKEVSDIVKDITLDEIVTKFISNLNLNSLQDNLFLDNGSLSGSMFNAIQKTIQSFLKDYKLLKKEDTLAVYIGGQAHRANIRSIFRNIHIESSLVTRWFSDQVGRQYSICLDRIPASYIIWRKRNENLADINFSLLSWVVNLLYRILVTEAPNIFFLDEESAERAINRDILNDVMEHIGAPWECSRQEEWIREMVQCLKRYNDKIIISEPGKWTNYMLPEFHSLNNTCYYDFKTAPPSLAASSTILQLLQEKGVDDISTVTGDKKYYGFSVSSTARTEFNWIGGYLGDFPFDQKNTGSRYKDYFKGMVISWRGDIIDYLDDIWEGQTIATKNQPNLYLEREIEELCRANYVFKQKPIEFAELARALNGNVMFSPLNSNELRAEKATQRSMAPL